MFLYPDEAAAENPEESENLENSRDNPDPAGNDAVETEEETNESSDNKNRRIETIDVHGGILWIGNSDSEGAPSPVLFTAGVGFPVSINKIVYFVPEIDFYGTNYQVTSGGRTVPTEMETANALWVLGILIDLPFVFKFSFNDNFSGGLSASTMLSFHIPFGGEGNSSRGDMNSYFYGKGRFFYLGSGFFLEYKILNILGLHFRSRLFFPFFHIWDGEKLPFYDQMMFSTTVGLRFMLK